MKLEDLLKPKFEVHIVCNEKEHYTKASGNTPSLLTALSAFVESLKDNDIDEELIRYAVNQGLMSDEQLDKQTKESLDKLIKKIFD